MTDITNKSRAGLPARGLAGIVAKAKAMTPAVTGAVAAARDRARLALIADCSGSMGDPVGDTTKSAALQASVDNVLIDAPYATLVAFASTARILGPGERLPMACGGTALHLALECAADFRHALVISDGAPDSADQALRVARRIVAGGTKIDTLFIGPDSDAEAIAFMRRLSEIGSGRASTMDIRKAQGSVERLSGAIRLLAAPR